MSMTSPTAAPALGAHHPVPSSAKGHSARHDHVGEHDDDDDDDDSMVLCLVQDSPVSFDLGASVAKLERLADDAAERARRLPGATPRTPVVVVFPEAFLSAYPRGYDFGAKIGSRSPEGRAWYARYHASSVAVSDVEGDACMAALRRCAERNRATVVVGVVERCDGPSSGPPRSAYGSANPGGSGTLYCTALTISPRGELLSAHRKLMPTGTERLVWGFGDGADVRVVETPAGRVGSVICWENYMPLQRAALYAQGVEVYCAPTADARDTWNSTMRHVGAEGRCFVVGCNQFNRRSDYPDDYPGFEGSKPDDIVNRGGSVIVSPLGEVLAGPLFDAAGILCVGVGLERKGRGSSSAAPNDAGGGGVGVAGQAGVVSDLDQPRPSPLSSNTNTNAPSTDATTDSHPAAPTASPTPSSIAAAAAYYARVGRREALAQARMDFDPTGHYARPDVFSLRVDAAAKPAVEFRR